MDNDHYSSFFLTQQGIVNPFFRMFSGVLTPLVLNRWATSIANPTRANKIRFGMWLFGILTGAISSAGEVRNTVLKWINDLLGINVDELSQQAIANALGEAAAEKLRVQILKRYNLAFPIDNLLSPTLMDELGAWFATIINDKASVRLGRDVFIVSTIFPPDNLLSEIDTFVADEINLKLGTSLSGVLFNQNLINELKQQVINRLQQELTNQFAQTKGQLINQYATAGGDDAELKMQLCAQIMTDALALFSSFQIDGFPINSAVYYAQNKKRIHTKMRQREYRRTHVEERFWVLR
jgi:hypothetical protein